MYARNSASPERVAIGALVTIADGSVATSGATISVIPQGGSAGAGGGTTSYENGIVCYLPLQTETNYTSFIVVAYKTGCIPASTTIITSASATPGYAGIDWSKVTAPTSTVGLTNTTVGVATALTNEAGKYSGGAVWVGPTANTNTVSYVDGIITNPVSTIAAAKTIADALKLRRFFTVRSGVSQIGEAMTSYGFDGNQWDLSTAGGSRDVGLSSFRSANVSAGTFAGTTGSIRWEICKFSNGVSVGISNMHNCRFEGLMTLIEAGSYNFVDCVSAVAGAITPVFALQAGAGASTISFRRWSGGISISGITSATVISIDMVSGGTVTLAGVDGEVQVRGMCAGIVDNRTGISITLGQVAALNRVTIPNAVWQDATAADFTTASSIGKALYTGNFVPGAANGLLLLTTAVDGTTTLAESLRLHNAVLGGKASGLEGATAVYRDLADTKDRIVATVDVDGNRTAVTRTLT